MKEAIRHINRWWLVSLLLVLLTACSDSDSEGGNSPDKPSSADPVLTFYVYAPERPMITRASDDDVAANTYENAIYNLQIWVFETGTNELVGYLNPDTYPTDDVMGTVYQMTVSKHFANASPKPNVDVYVVANANAAGLSSLGENTSREELEEAKIGSEYFGVGSPVTNITTKGLPMSGVLRDQTIIGSEPVLTIGTEETMAKVRLLRAVSKVRFVFSRETGVSPVTITNITIDGNMIPTEEYVFLEDNKTYHIGQTYETLAATLLKKPTGEIKYCDEPTDYVYTDQTSQEYEPLIDNGVSEEKLTQAGPYYFKESDKKISGMITYKVGNALPQNIPFYMSVEDINKRFVRNHSWIVYAYYNGSSGEPIITVWVDTNWQTGDYFVIEN